MKTFPLFGVALLVLALSALPAQAEPAPPDVVMKGHAGTVMALAFSPDGTRLASTSDDGSLKVWDLSLKTLVFSIDGAYSQKNQIRFTPDGKTLVTLGTQNNVLIIDVLAGKLRRSIAISNLPGGPAALDLSPDGKTIAVVGRSTLRFIDLATSATKLEYEVHKLYAVTSVAFSPDGSRVATASTDNTGLVIEIATGKIVQTMGLELKGEAVLFLRDGKTVLTYATDQVLRAFNVETGESRKLLGESVPFLTLELSRDGKTLILGGCGRAPWLYSLTDSKLVNMAYDSEDRVKSASISPDGKWIAGGANEGPIYLWKVTH